MSLHFDSVENRRELAEFIANLNSYKIHHVGYCGESANEIFDALTNETFTFLHSILLSVFRLIE
ncbi:hypothetical protein J9303_17790 [Bacillaceae bacterium Marseille-Q3522]|nr:hypothetical protein [Bacillaceae bacterium Marseille-Q3522]